MIDAAEKPYVGDVGTTIIIDTGIDLSSATLIKIKVMDPKHTTLEWIAEVDPSNNKFIRYITHEGDFKYNGYYFLQPYVELSTWKGSGETCRIKINSEFQ
jgi:hypothetical protein